MAEKSAKTGNSAKYQLCQRGIIFAARWPDNPWRSFANATKYPPPHLLYWRRIKAVVGLLFLLSIAPGGGLAQSSSPATYNYTLIAPDPGRPDFVLKPAYARGTRLIRHTGADYYDYVNSQNRQRERLRVMRWDYADGIALGWVFGELPSGFTGVIYPRQVRPNDQFVDGTKAVEVGIASDPDVTVWFDPAEQVWYVALTFVQEIDGTSRAMQSLFRYLPREPNTMEPVVGISAYTYPQPVSLPRQQACHTPNVDVSVNGTVVYVYEDAGTVFATARSLKDPRLLVPEATESRPIPISEASSTSCYPDDRFVQAYHPDVAVWDTPRGDPEPMVHVSYAQRGLIFDTDSIHRILVTSLPLAAIVAGSPRPNCSQTVTVFGWADETPLVTGVYSSFRYPRIAPVHGANPAEDQLSYLVTWSRTSFIIGLPPQYQIQLRANQAGTLTQTRPTTVLAACINTEPAVAVAYNPLPPGSTTEDASAAVVWSYRPPTSLPQAQCFDPAANPLDGWEVLAVPVTLDGTPLNAQNTFAAVNQEMTGHQHACSVSGGHAYVPGDPTILYVWASNNARGQMSEIRYREAPAGATSYRPTSPVPSLAAATLAVVPNPADGAGTFQLQLPADEYPLTLTVGELTAGSSTRALAATNWSEEADAAVPGGRRLSLPLGQLLPATAPDGLYVLQVVTNYSHYTIRFRYAR